MWGNCIEKVAVNRKTEHRNNKKNYWKIDASYLNIRQECFHVDFY